MKMNQIEVFENEGGGITLQQYDIGLGDDVMISISIDQVDIICREFKKLKKLIEGCRAGQQ